MFENWPSIPIKYVPLFGAVFVGSYSALKLANYCTRRKHRFLREDAVPLASRITALTHAVSLMGISGMAMYYDPWFGIQNTEWQKFALQFTISYFTYDLVYMYFCEWDWKFVIHHLIVISSMGTGLFLDKGGAYAMMMLFPGEITNPCYMSWELSKRYGYDCAHRMMSYIFTWSFLTIRLLMLTPLSGVILYRLLFVHDGLSHLTKGLWVSCILGFNYGNYLWSRNMWKGYQKFRQKERERLAALPAPSNEDKED